MILERDVHGPTFHLAWKLATPAKQAMAIKSRNIWAALRTIMGLDTIIYDRESSVKEPRSTDDGWVVEEWVEETYVVFERDDALVSAPDAGKRGGLVGWFQAVD